MKMPRFLRLLPAVVIAGTAVLALKGVDIARASQGGADAAAYADQDSTALAPIDHDARPAKDYAADDTTLASAAEVDVLTRMTQRREELDARERALTMRENLLHASEGRVDQKIAALTTLQTQIQALLQQRDAKQDAQIASLVKTYSTMKARDAAGIFNTLDDEVLVPIAKSMKSDVLGPILAAMKPDVAQKLTVKLAALLKLPETPPEVCPVTAAAPAAGTSADATTPPAAVTPPVQTALANPPVTLTPPPAVIPPAPAPAASMPPPAATPPAHAPPATPPVQTAAAATPPKSPHHAPAHHNPPPKSANQAAATPPKPANTTPAIPPVATPPAAIPPAASAPAAPPSSTPAGTPPKPTNQAATTTPPAPAATTAAPAPSHT
ncbi:MAG: hypothetical protein JO348_04090 [Alphaproteobacteria bacterium]|nr:hypothetical protein [Alphaproteobacteria bacterium]